MQKVKVFLLTYIVEWAGDTEVSTEIFTSHDKAKEYMEKLISDNEYFVDDVNTLIEEGNLDCHIEMNDDTFFCYDGLNFDSIEIIITDKEIEVETERE